MAAGVVFGEQVAARGVPFTVDEIWDLLFAAGWAEPREPSAMSAVVNKLRGRKLIVSTGEFVHSRYSQRHHRQTEWIMRSD